MARRFGSPDPQTNPQIVWVPSPQLVVVAAFPAPAALMVPVRTFVPKVTMFADITNIGSIYIGPQMMTIALGAQPNIAFWELPPAGSAEIETDDEFNEFFDLGKFYVINNTATAMNLYLTSWNPVRQNQ